ncbi:acyltransferase [Rheinheimera sp. D18]|uniref:acyltransferase family protein n=1 Tax=Rheinheimera sp. D18 TaxID=2545632 RepID=UPI0010438036|nr:acyltransferase [Rheinheimera sp. D18]QBL08428.1 acyltransferase [Rheinheimera sp. D18]
MHFRSDINGLRAIAVIAVLLFHFQPTWLPGGFAGVDVFFVISGYLMTAIIFNGLQQQKFSLIGFYVARANRIIPALAALCSVLLLLGYLYLTPIEFRTLGKHVASSIGFISNITYWLESGYFASASKEKWLLHTWSLSVEWQFYLIYPLVLSLLAYVFSLKILKRLVIAATLLGLAYSIITTRLWPEAAYFLFPARAWEMLIGGVAFLYPFTLKAQHKLPVEWLGLLLILSSYLLFSEHNPWPGYLALAPVVGTFLVIQAQRENSVVTNNIVLQKIGSSSYSIYLWHWPLVVLGYLFLPHYWFAIGVPLSFIFGWLSYQYIESFRFKKLVRVFDLYKAVPLYFAVSVALLGAVVFVTNGKNYWLQRQSDIIKQTYQVISQNVAAQKQQAIEEDGLQQLTACRFNIDKLTAPYRAKLKQCFNQYGKGILIIGDSHAIDLFSTVTTKFNDAFIVGITSVGCRPHKYDPNCQYNDVKRLITEQPLFKHIIFEQGGFYLLRDKQGDSGSRAMFSRLALSEPVTGISVNTDNVDKVMQYLTELSNFTPVTWFGSRLEPHISTRQILQRGCNYAFTLRDGQQQPFDELDQYISRHLPADKKLRFISQNALMQFDFSRDLLSCQEKFWDDGDHFSQLGKVRFSQRLPNELLRFAN